MPWAAPALVDFLLPLIEILTVIAAAVIFLAYMEAMGQNVPVVGGYITRGAKAALDWVVRKVTPFAQRGEALLAGLVNGLGETSAEFASAVNEVLVALPAQLAHLVRVKVPALIEDAVKPVRDTATAAATDAGKALTSIDQLYPLPLRDFPGIEHGVRDLVDHLRDVVQNVDLPGVLDQAQTTARDLVHNVELGVDGLRDEIGRDVGDLWDALNKIPLQDLLDGVAAAGATAALVGVLEREAGLDSAECRAKVKQICATDPAAWQALLDVAGLALAFMGLREFVALSQELGRETIPPMLEAVRGG